MTASKFKLGDRVYCPWHGYGTITTIYDDGCLYPIEVTWDDIRGEDVSPFTEDGCLSQYSDNDSTVLKVVDKESTKKEKKSMAEDKKFKVGDNVWSSKRDNVWSSKREVDSINPAHYRVKGIPEAYDIMTHLMTREQLEGFFWGNIIKYAYRYGRKGDEAETAGKIAWYAQKLKELGECESE